MDDEDLRRLQEQQWEERPDFRGVRITRRLGFWQKGRRLAHRPDGTCVFLTPERTCSIYEVRPGICELYLCRRDSKTRFRELLRDSGTQTRIRKRMLEQAVASATTQSYKAVHGTSWDQPSYRKALNEIKEHYAVRNAEALYIHA